MDEPSTKFGTVACVGRSSAPVARALLIAMRVPSASVIDALVSHGAEVWHTSVPPTNFDGFDIALGWDLLSGWAFDFSPPPDVPVLNIHRAWLPYNRGEHPHFWCFYDGTPSGVSLHVVDGGTHTGPVVCQRQIDIDIQRESFRTANERLQMEGDALVVEQAAAIVNRSFVAFPQRRAGSIHSAKDLPDGFAEWDANIAESLARLDEAYQAATQGKLGIIDEIERIRSANNVNWMDILRLAFKSSPAEAKVLINRINTDDNRISRLFAKLGE